MNETSESTPPGFVQSLVRFVKEQGLMPLMSGLEAWAVEAEADGTLYRCVVHAINDSTPGRWKNGDRIWNSLQNNYGQDRPTRTAFSGGRKHYLSRVEIRWLEDVVGTDETVCVGDCPTGTDKSIRQWARSTGRTIEVFEAEWDRLGNRAGPLRNRSLVQSSDRLIAFPGGKGTASAIKFAQKASIDVYDLSAF